MPFVIRVRGIHVYMYLFPNERSGLFRSEGIVNYIPYFVAINRCYLPTLPMSGDLGKLT